MDTETKHLAYHSAPYHAAGTAIMSFKPINAIHQHLCAFHVYSCVFLSLSLRFNTDKAIPAVKIALDMLRHITIANTSQQTFTNASSTTRTSRMRG